MKLSIITPCTRPYNLPVIYKSLLNSNFFFDSTEWIIIYNNEFIDERIKVYEEETIKIVLGKYIKTKEDTSVGSGVRNEGLKYVTGDLIVYLDDDNIIHPDFFDYISKHFENDKILIFNQFNDKFSGARLPSVFSINNIVPGYIDTAQIIVPSLYKHIFWPITRNGTDEYTYLINLLNYVGVNKIKWVNEVITYRNYIKRKLD